ncbi:MAG: hypothetical protein Q7T71_06805, partial [Herbiconiux sp.]|nr:hypothetical protein [Herbiconiux sp.]
AVGRRTTLAPVAAFALVAGSLVGAPMAQASGLEPLVPPSVSGSCVYGSELTLDEGTWPQGTELRSSWWLNSGCKYEGLRPLGPADAPLTITELPGGRLFPVVEYLTDFYGAEEWVEYYTGSQLACTVLPARRPRTWIRPSSRVRCASEST